MPPQKSKQAAHLQDHVVVHGASQRRVWVQNYCCRATLALGCFEQQPLQLRRGQLNHEPPLLHHARHRAAGRRHRCGCLFSPACGSAADLVDRLALLIRSKWCSTLGRSWAARAVSVCRGFSVKPCSTALSQIYANGGRDRSASFAQSLRASHMHGMRHHPRKLSTFLASEALPHHWRKLAKCSRGRQPWLKVPRCCWWPPAPNPTSLFGEQH